MDMMMKPEQDTTDSRALGERLGFHKCWRITNRVREALDSGNDARAVSFDIS